MSVVNNARASTVRSFRYSGRKPIVPQIQLKTPFDEHTLGLPKGVHQGIPLGLTRSCLVIGYFTEPWAQPLNVRYLDDGTTGGAPLVEDSLMEAIKANTS
ncbi:hypothetical protein RvY_03035 [Ramazzottius varieornatus]|uniref:Uncharacterized protein n=1 Tax=Ramazzottius varieornatus TaxID=947166 RepID=A0A1D1ULP7_RAMVA|nr:hypothetical protein RvY_03035 [Ramazzottius varieornatus]